MLPAVCVDGNALVRRRQDDEESGRSAASLPLGNLLPLIGTAFAEQYLPPRLYPDVARLSIDLKVPLISRGDSTTFYLRLRVRRLNELNCPETGPSGKGYTFLLFDVCIIGLCG